jgi:hypothetical protein
MSWSPTARRNAVSGAARLFSREDWRQSEHGPVLDRIIRAAVEDDDPVNRLHAAYVIRLLEPDNQRTLALVRRRLLVEPEAHVAAALTNELAVVARRLPADVDAVLTDLTESSLWQTRIAPREDSRDDMEPFVSLVLWLAIAHQAPVATALAAGWFSRPSEGLTARPVFWLLRPWLSLPPARAEERRRAFALVRTAAAALESTRRMTEPAEAADIYRIADAIVDQLYFASGAFGRKDDTDREPVPAEEGFAEEAFSVIELLTEFKHPTIIHPIVQTLGHVSPSNPRKAFLLVARSISEGDAYTYDPLAADTTIALIERYFAEYRDVVATDPDVLTAIRRLLDAFVRVGWPAAVSLSYRLGDAFR